MIGRPPRSTLFPSPPLSRSQDHDRHAGRVVPEIDVGAPRQGHRVRDLREMLAHGGTLAERVDTLRLSPGQRAAVRSEEHTSELQSRLHLVCRLLLEKKKKTN